MKRIQPTIRFFANLLRDIAGTLAGRWRRFHRRVVLGEDIASVGVDVYPFFEKMTGVGWYEWNLLAALDRRDDGLQFNLYAHTFLAPEEPMTTVMPGFKSMRFRLHHLPSEFLFPVGPTVVVLRRVVEPLLRWLDGNDVLFAPNFFMPKNQLAFGQTVVATVHDLAFKVMPETVNPETLEALHDNLLETLFRSERLVAVSDATAGDIYEHLGLRKNRVRVVHEGLDPSFAGENDSAPPEDLPPHYLLFLSTLEPRKNVLGVLRAFKLVVEWGYSGHLVLVGRWGWHTENIRKELEESPVRDRIIHLDYIEREQLPGLYRESDALLFPSWMEGFGLPLLEAMACGTPVVTSGCSAMPEVAGPAAIYVDPASPHGIASAISTLMEDDDHRKRLSDAGKKRAARFSWDEAAAATAQILRQAAGLTKIGEDEYRV
ncbi:MAG: glycosyltransferase family 4 protein [Thermoanaerobaculales bacterium]|nr:glycosyltransferase family 4 protein [Thermoanaerobaculales bacterium]